MHGTLHNTRTYARTEHIEETGMVAVRFNATMHRATGGFLTVQRRTAHPPHDPAAQRRARLSPLVLATPASQYSSKRRAGLPLSKIPLACPPAEPEIDASGYALDGSSCKRCAAGFWEDGKHEG